MIENLNTKYFTKKIILVIATISIIIVLMARLHIVHKYSYSQIPCFEKVIIHYSKISKDELKLKAAKYLFYDIISHNYHGRYSEEFKSLLDTTIYSLNASSEMQIPGNKKLYKENRCHFFDQFLKSHIKTFGDPRTLLYETRRDIDQLTAEYLIQYIDLAFKAWELPWAKAYSFEEFCKFILPYRYGTEPLEEWRGFYWDKLSWVIDSFKTETDPIKVAIAINEFVGKDFWYSDYLISNLDRPELSPIQMFKGKIAGPCHEQFGLGVSLMRTMGIATTEINIPAWGFRASGHVFCAVLSNITHKWIDFHAGCENPGQNYLYWKPPKAYLNSKDQLPKRTIGFLFEGWMDITKWYNKTIDLTIDIQIKTKAKVAYLCTFNNHDWTPVTSALIKNNRAQFFNVGCNKLYMPFVVEKNYLRPINSPITIDSMGIVSHIRSTTEKTNFTFSRKYTENKRDTQIRCDDIMGGYFEIANDATFKNAKRLCSIEKIETGYPDTMIIEPVKTRFIRFVFPEIKRNYQNGPAWLAFYANSSEEPLHGKYLYSNNFTSKNVQDVFDDDLLTFINFIPYYENLCSDMGENAVYRYPLKNWMGYDFGEEKEITSIGICARNDKNYIYKGMYYELFFWDNDWVSLGEKRAETNQISFENIPKGALLWLRNLTEGNEERVFTVTNGEINWW